MDEDNTVITEKLLALLICISIIGLIVIAIKILAA